MNRLKFLFKLVVAAHLLVLVLASYGIIAAALAAVFTTNNANQSLRLAWIAGGFACLTTLVAMGLKIISTWKENK